MAKRTHLPDEIHAVVDPHSEWYGHFGTIVTEHAGGQVLLDVGTTATFLSRDQLMSYRP